MNNDNHDPLNKEIDFSNARYGSVIPPDPNKTRITIRLDSAVISWFKTQVANNSGSYQSLINEALKSYIRQQEDGEKLEKLLRRVLREEINGITTH
uniref:BrnA antitoxin of type II toxin-antitoxin system n=1 Tax=Candidatus Kentrum sp. FW TaxID=2126338 RepID=A0A450T2E6_9GAMM|nr:MAG: BrnA antitoxin of type II toxin-antitoxin system [Candidatus Kentron sp. FW]